MMRSLIVVAFVGVLGSATSASAQDPHAGHHAPQPAPASPAAASTVELPAHLPPLTDADRVAAFPQVDGHRVHDHAINTFVLLDQFEWRSGHGADAFVWEARSWIGGDRTRLWLRGDGEHPEASRGEGDVEVLYGRAVSRWWDVVAGVRHDLTPGADRTWAAVGVQGLAPYWFDVEATAYLGGGGHTQLHLEATHDLLVTNRLVLQPRAEVTVQGKRDVARGLDRGVAAGELGFRLRYEFRREFAPYVGVTWPRAFFGTRELRQTSGGRTGGARLVVGVRWWR